MKTLLLLLLISISLSTTGSEMDYQKIKKQYPNAEYIVIERTINVSYFINPKSGELNARSVHNVTLLALKDDCDELQSIQIPYNGFENVTVLSAKYSMLDSTNELRLLENIKVKFLKSKDYYISGILYNDLKVMEITPTVPIKERLLVKYSYEYTYKDTRFLNSIQIQENNENVLKFELLLTIPEYVKADLFPFNISNKEDIKETIENGAKVWIYNVKNILAKKKHEYTPPLNYFSPSFVITTNNYTTNTKTIDILGSTQNLYKWYAGLVKQLIPDRLLIKKLAEEITKGKTTITEKTEAIFQWVQKNIHYVAFEDGIAGFKPEEAQKVITTKYGDCKGMANALVELLKAENITAYHTWIGTRHLNYPLSTNSLSVNNHMICTVVIDNEFYYLDPTDKGALWNKTPDHLQGKEALIGKDSNFEVKTIPINSIGNNLREIHFDCIFSNDFRKLFTTAEATFQGQEAIELCNAYNFSGFQTKKRLDNNFFSFFTQSFVPDSSTGSMPTLFNKEKIACRQKGEILGATVYDGKKIFFFLDQVPFLDNISLEKLETPLYFSNKRKLVINYTIHLPSNVKIQTLPTAKNFKTSDNSISCTINYKTGVNEINISREIMVNTLMCELKDTAIWKKLLVEIKREENTPLIFSL